MSNIYIIVPYLTQTTQSGHSVCYKCQVPCDHSFTCMHRIGDNCISSSTNSHTSLIVMAQEQSYEEVTPLPVQPILKEKVSPRRIN